MRVARWIIRVTVLGIAGALGLALLAFLTLYALYLLILTRFLFPDIFWIVAGVCAAGLAVWIWKGME